MPGSQMRPGIHVSPARYKSGYYPEREHLHSPSSPPVLEFGAEHEKASPGRYYFRGVWPNQAGSCRYLVHQTL